MKIGMRHFRTRKYFRTTARDVTKAVTTIGATQSEREFILCSVGMTF